MTGEGRVGVFGRTARQAIGSLPVLPSGCDQGYAVIDVETTGLSPASARVIQIGVVQLGPSLQHQAAWSTLIDAGCGPGPTHIHGITADMLIGAPCFSDVHAELVRRTSARVMVAHNASFDWGMLAAEAARLRSPVPIRSRLCTLTLARRIDFGLPDARLGTLAGHFGIEQRRAHDALDDARTTAALLPILLGQLSIYGVDVPFVACTNRDAPAIYPTYVRKTTCAYRNPGLFVPPGPLVQGMKIAFTGDMSVPREQLIKRAVGAGLDVTTAVSARTSILVCNDEGLTTSKALRAKEEGTPVLNEAAFINLLENVAVGTHKSAPPPSSRAADMPTPKQAPPASGPLTGRRILIVGGPHEVASDLREQVTSLGAVAAVNLTARVTDVVALDDVADPRLDRATERGLPVQRLAEFLARLAGGPPAHGPSAPVLDEGDVAPHVLIRGAVIDLPPTSAITLNVSWSWGAGEVDLLAFVVDEDELVRDDCDFVFYNQNATPDGVVRLTVDGPEEQAIAIALDGLGDDVRKVVVAASLTGTETFAAVGPIALDAADEAGRPIATATLDAATTETEMLLAEIYRRGDVWRFRAVGQGYHAGLAALATSFGVSVDDD